MQAHADKTQQNKSQAIANNLSKQQSDGEAALEFEDNRPAAIQMRKLQDMANNSPQVAQLRAIQGMANNSPQSKQAAQIRAMANSRSIQLHQPIQKKENESQLTAGLNGTIDASATIQMNGNTPPPPPPERDNNTPPPPPPERDNDTPPPPPPERDNDTPPPPPPERDNDTPPPPPPDGNSRAQTSGMAAVSSTAAANRQPQQGQQQPLPALKNDSDDDDDSMYQQQRNKAHSPAARSSLHTETFYATDEETLSFGKVPEQNYDENHPPPIEIVRQVGKGVCPDGHDWYEAITQKGEKCWRCKPGAHEMSFDLKMKRDWGNYVWRDINS